MSNHYQINISPGSIVDCKLLSGLEVPVCHARGALAFWIKIRREFSVVVIGQVPEGDQGRDRLLHVVRRRHLQQEQQQELQQEQEHQYKLLTMSQSFAYFDVN